jgi:hypothetical protein
MKQLDTPETKAAFWMRGYLISMSTDPSVPEAARAEAKNALELWYDANPCMRPAPPVDAPIIYCSACDEQPADPNSAKGCCRFCQADEDDPGRTQIVFEDLFPVAEDRSFPESHNMIDDILENR